ncbi:DUF1177 domain-containing protein [Haloferax denitrificans]|uniref:DUF1177 domain-containing protein n=2 Tax=Haloferax TaxID=2251 RepID=M0JLP8_9EURY|nr:DUF1177 domain-containing protein [Haloferax denitrificans]EMA08590.1 hypothetical protein C438_02085 [Haloferax denitrificans ATCC 35960]
MFDKIQQAYDILSRPDADGELVRDALETYGLETEVTTISTDEGETDFVKTVVPGRDPDAPTLGVVGRLGGVAARPAELGPVSDADGAIVALAVALHLGEMRARGDVLAGDVRIATHVCPDAPTSPHDPVPFMGSPVDTSTMNEHEVDEEMDAVVSVDATKGNRVHCERGFAITPTVKEGWVLKVSDSLLDIQERATGRPPSTLTLTMQDITPYGNDVHHINSILQPATATDAPVVGVATTSVSPVPGCGTGANYLTDLLDATGFVVETAKDFTRGRASFYDEAEYDRLTSLYGSMGRLQTLGEGV